MGLCEHEISHRYVSACKSDYAISISVPGNGFCEEALKHAKEQFYMDDISRSSRTHFGIGLYAADSIAKGHGGHLTVKNSSKTHGGEVTLTIAC